MTTTMHAVVSWVPSSKGGRPEPPSGPVYSTVARFEEDRTWPHKAWSLVVRKLDAFEGGRFWFAEVGFLADTGPVDLLHPGARFELHEGPHLVATGLISPSAAQAPSRAEEFAAVLLS